MMSLDHAALEDNEGVTLNGNVSFWYDEIGLP